MKTKHLITILTLLFVSLLNCFSQVEIVPTGNGNWSSTVPDSPWPGGIIPAATNGVYFNDDFSITVDTNVTIAYIDSNNRIGKVTMAPGTTLTVLGDSAGALGTQSLGLLDASAPSNTVIYMGNAFWAQRTNYYNLVFAGNPTNVLDFYSGATSGYDGVAMHVAGDMSVLAVKVQQGADFTIGGSLILDTNASWDCSSFNFNVASNLSIGKGALLIDLDAASGSNNIGGNVTVSSTALGWNLTDVTTWYLGGSLTNNGTIVGKPTGWASIFFNGTGTITGSQPIKIPTMTINGTYFIADSITLTTNNANFNGTLIFDLARTNQIILKYSPTTNALNTTLTNYYGGNLIITNSGLAPVSGKTYKFFSASNYAGVFNSTIYPPLASGLSWVDNSLINGSYAVTGAVLGPPTLTIARSGVTLTLTWDSTTYPGYNVKAQTNSPGTGTGWMPTGSGTTSPYQTTINPAGPPIFYKLSNP